MVRMYRLEYGNAFTLRDVMSKKLDQEMSRIADPQATEAELRRCCWLLYQEMCRQREEIRELKRGVERLGYYADRMPRAINER